MKWDLVKAMIETGDGRLLSEYLASQEFFDATFGDIIKIVLLLRKRRRYLEAELIVNGVGEKGAPQERIKLQFLKADLLIDQEKYREAIRVYSDVIALEDSDIAFNNRGLAFWSSGEYELALADYLSALKLNGGNKTALRGAGEMHLKLAKPELAIAFFKKAIGVDPKYTEAISGLGVALYQCGRYADAFDQFQLAVKLDPTNELALKGIKVIEDEILSDNSA